MTRTEKAKPCPFCASVKLESLVNDGVTDAGRAVLSWSDK